VTAAGNEPLVNADHPDAMPPGAQRGLASAGRGESAPPAVERWLDAMRPRLVRLAVRLLWNVHDAEEIAQEALLCAYQRLGRLREPASRNTWLYRITINLAHNRARRRRTEPLPPNVEVAALPDDAGPPEGRARLPDRVREAIARLPERQQAALVLREMEGLAYEEVAAILDVRAGAARLLVHRAREAVRQTVLRQWPSCLEDAG
jgi:RNA polymerase sigma-70 factor, ECF subfamily